MIASHRFPTFRHSEVDLDYLLMLLQSEQGRALMGINSPGAAGRNRTIRLNQFLDEEVPLPPLQEQQKIVSAFRTEEAHLETLQARIRDAVVRLKELRIYLIASAVTGKIDVRDEAA
jgi:type I restriction enzyme S subunit